MSNTEYQPGDTREVQLGEIARAETVKIAGMTTHQLYKYIRDLRKTSMRLANMVLITGVQVRVACSGITERADQKGEVGYAYAEGRRAAESGELNAEELARWVKATTGPHVAVRRQRDEPSEIPTNEETNAPTTPPSTPRV